MWKAQGRARESTRAHTVMSSQGRHLWFFCFFFKVMSPEGLVVLDCKKVESGEEADAAKARLVSATNVTGLKERLQNAGTRLAQKGDLLG